MNAENLAYTAVQVVHNFGAAAVVGGAVFARWPTAQDPVVQRWLAWLVLAGWVAQAASGSLFGAVSVHYYGQFPDIHGIAVAALGIKIAAAVVGVAVAAAFLRLSARWGDTARRRAWAALTGAGVVALTAAAFLRWFS
ncbi:MAG: hypothetical protein EHM83_05680 [Burkholderiales bacterium]|nr:MAG: hypothetical protein EHM83_05680 [Burkholderiales bacterium]